MKEMPYSPHDLLPIKNPRINEHENDQEYFYRKVIQHLIPDIIRMTNNGIPIDLNKVEELQKITSGVLKTVEDRLANNKLMQEFLSIGNKVLIDKKVELLHSKKKDYTHFLKECDFKNMTHRSYVVNQYLKDTNRFEEFGKDTWAIKELKKLNQVIASKFISDLLEGSIEADNEIVLKAMKQLAEDKAILYNKNYDNKVEALEDTTLYEAFNCKSPVQMQKFFDFLNIDSEAETKSGNGSWSRKELEKLLVLVKILVEEDNI